MTRSGKNSIKRIISSKVFLFFITLALIAVAVNVGRESYRKYQLTQEINNLKTEIQKLEGKNEQLADLMEYLKEEPYLEKEARLKLNMKKPGERVVVISDKGEEIELPQPKEENNPVNVLTNIPEGETTNYWEWWQYFFKP